ncbi:MULTISPECIES: acyl carrier protein [unclassified Streptomyces]|uniref:acyl carrier protein n=1 Tax=unclassified Streptomyces TaxID=2593676 RepID=UPI003820F1CE
MTGMTYDDLLARATARTALNHRLKVLLAEGLGLTIRPDLIGDDQPLFGRGLGLDSLDTLEIVVMIEEDLGVGITDDEREVFGSINKLADCVIARRGGIPLGGSAA